MNRIEYEPMNVENMDEIVKKYVEYYNSYEGGCWTEEKAYKRIHQIVTIEDGLSFIQKVDGVITGFVMGFYKQFDDLLCYFVEEIVIFKNEQNKGLGTKLLNKVEEITKQNGVEHIELISVHDEMHMHFYEKLGYYRATNLKMMGKHFKR